MTKEMKTKFMEKFKVPAVAEPYLGFMFTQEEMEVTAFIEKDPFTVADVAELWNTSDRWKEKAESMDVEQFCDQAYRKGLFSYVDNSMNAYRISDFYDRLDIFAISEQDTYRSIPKEGQKAMADWAFHQYFSNLNPDKSVRPGNDEVLSLEEMMAFIDGHGDDPVYLNHCDCKSLNGECGKPTEVCITYKDGVNSYAHRGHSRRITAQEAKEVVRKADQAGLMHTISGLSICNCCDDCCYVFRSMKQRGSVGFWPKSNHIISWDGKKCVHCGLCIRRCMMDVFSKPGERIAMDTIKCVGCGICATACPKGALELIPR